MPVTYSSYLKVDELLTLQQSALGRAPSTTRCSSSSSTRCTSSGSSRCCTSSTTWPSAPAPDDAAARPHTLKRILTILKIAGRPDRHPRDHDAARVPVASASGSSRRAGSSRASSASSSSRSATSSPAALAAATRRAAAARDRLRARGSDAPSLWDALPRASSPRGATRCPRRAARARRARARSRRRRRCRRVLDRRLPRRPRRWRALCERLVDLDEGLQEWRYRHVKMVERTIGAKPGTGGSAGAAYLQTTLNRPLFPDLWAIRREL